MALGRHNIHRRTRPMYKPTSKVMPKPINQMLLQRTHEENKKKAMIILKWENPVIHELYVHVEKLVQKWVLKFSKIDELLERKNLSQERRSQLIKTVDKKLSNPKKYGKD